MGFNKLPDECVSTILSLSSPRDVCRSSVACSALQSAARSDFVWESFLPLDYNDIVSRADPRVAEKFGTKKELFFMLSDSVPIDGGTKIFMIERSHGLKAYILSAREISIAWANVPMYWCWKNDPHSRFQETAELRTIWWLEIHGQMKIKSLSPNTTYGAYLICKVSERAYGLDKMPMQISVQVGNDPVCRNTVHFRLDDDGQKEIKTQWLIHYDRVETVRSKGPVEGSVAVVRGARDDGWMEIELGRFFSGDDYGDDREVKMSLMEIEGQHLKGGLIVDGIEIRPLGS